MSKKILVVMCLVMMATVFSGCDLLGGNKNQEATKEGANVEQNKESSEDKEESFFGSMQDLIARGKSLKCTYNVTDEEGGEVSGIIYVADDKRRTESEIINKETNKKIKMNSMHLGEWMYSWSSSSVEGMKMNLKEMYGDEKFEKYSQGETDSMKKKIDYRCQAWIVDNAKFTIPVDVDFKDMTEIMGGFDINKIN